MGTPIFSLFLGNGAYTLNSKTIIKMDYFCTITSEMYTFLSSYVYSSITEDEVHSKLDGQILFCRITLVLQMWN